jgi:hypothetical protein
MKTTETTEEVSSHPEEKGRWNKIASKHFPRSRKREGGLGKTTCKSMKQDENEQNYKKGPTPVVDKKPDGKYQNKMMLLQTL